MTIVDGYAYACASYLVQIKWTHCQILAWIISVRTSDCHKMHIMWLSDFSVIMLTEVKCNFETHNNMK